MFDNIMKFFKKRNKKQNSNSSSKDTAKERLHLVLMPFDNSKHIPINSGTDNKIVKIEKIFLVVLKMVVYLHCLWQ